MTGRTTNLKRDHQRAALHHALRTMLALAAAVVSLSRSFSAPGAAFTLVSCPPGAENAACSVPNLSAQPLTTPHSGGWLVAHLAGSWLALLLIGLVAASEVARAPLARRAETKPGSLIRTVRALAVPGSRAGRCALAACALLVLLAGLAGDVAWTRSTSRTVVVRTPYQQHGSFSYSAPASGTIYDGDAARNGEPVFLALSHEVDLTFAYSLSTEPESQLAGTYWLSALVGDSSGWRKTIDLVPQNGFDGSTFSASATLNLDQLRGLVDDYERQTGLRRDQYLLAIVAQIAVHGTIAGRYFDDTFAPELDFSFDHSALRLADHPASVDPLSPTVDGTAEGASVVQARIGAGGAAVPVSLLRWLALAAAAAGVAGAGGLLWRAVRAAPQDELARIGARYGRRLVVIRHGQLVDAPALDVRAIEDLGRLAEQLHLPILVDEGSPRYYYVRHGGQLYRYRQLAESSASPMRVEELFR